MGSSEWTEELKERYAQGAKEQDVARIVTWAGLFFRFLRRECELMSEQVRRSDRSRRLHPPLSSSRRSKRKLSLHWTHYSRFENSELQCECNYKLYIPGYYSNALYRLRDSLRSAII